MLSDAAMQNPTETTVFTGYGWLVNVQVFLAASGLQKNDVSGGFQDTSLRRPPCPHRYSRRMNTTAECLLIGVVRT